MRYRIICFDNNVDVKNSVCDIMETSSLGTALIRLLDYKFHKEDSYGEPISKTGLTVFKDWETNKIIYNSKSVRDFEYVCNKKSTIKT
tara:strand:- start:402 stop:665 length:264 start_codon:yes stop_codon:yes gene_type:complete